MAEDLEPVHEREPYHGADERLVRLRHSAAHIMAEAILSFFPEAKLGIGPPIEDGFYYDFLLPRPLTPEDLPKIEEKMREIVAAKSPFLRVEIDKGTARERFRDQPFKLELIEDIPSPTVSLYTQHSFTDLCQGPHVEATDQVRHFKLLRTAGAYWRGKETNPQLQRIYGACFPTQEELDEHLRRLEEAERRDHRRLGRELELFMFDPLAPASPFFLPKGAVIYNLMVEFMRGLYPKYGYQEVITPQVFSSELWKRSGHYDNYRDSMYFTTVEEREYGVKPMNCPGHILIYASRLHSYRELPLRYADFGRLHRFERSGVTHGLTRVRSFSQDDAHIFCPMDRVQGEIALILQMTRETYDAFGLGEPRFTLSLRPPKRLGADEMWDQAEAALRDALRSSGRPFQEVPGEGAFYGPKIDLFIRDALNREWQLSTFQLDFNLPERFSLEYVAEDGSLQRPVMVHRAILGSLERFFGVLLEHNAGAFPVWLAPVQAVVIPIADRHTEYARSVEARLREAGLRAHLDDRNERMNLKIREAQVQKVPYMLVVGDRETREGTVSVRLRNGQDAGPQEVEGFLAGLRKAVAERS